MKDKGRSFGKKIGIRGAGIEYGALKVVDYTNGKEITINQALIRNLSEIVVAVLTGGLSVFLSMSMLVFSQNQRRIGDLLANTVVIVDHNTITKKLPKWTPRQLLKIEKDDHLVSKIMQFQILLFLGLIYYFWFWLVWGFLIIYSL